MIDFSNFSQYRDVLSEMVRLKVVDQRENKKWLGVSLFAYFFSALRKSRVAVRAKPPANKVTPLANKR